MATDLELLESWRGGDQDAADELLARHFDPVCRFFRTKLGDDVDDLVQRTFEDMVRSRDRVVGDDGFRAYLFGIARHRLLDHLRGRDRGQPVDFDAKSMADFATSASQRVARSQEEALLLEAMRHIPVDQQIALELTYWEGMKGAQIADVLGVSPHTVRSRLARARSALREKVEQLAANPGLRASTLDRLAAFDEDPDTP